MPPRGTMNACAAARLIQIPLLFTAFAIGVSSAACTRLVEVPRDPGRQAYYQTGFPRWDTSGALERAFASVRRIQVTAIYETYVFAPESAPRETEVGAPDVLHGAVDTISSTEERAATAVVISRSGENVVLLTANHALEFPDTLIAFSDEEGGRRGGAAEPAGSRRVRAVSIKVWQTHWVVGESRLAPFEILSRDAVTDLALIGIHEPEGEAARSAPLPPRPWEARSSSPVLALAAGDSDRLSWGSFVYVLGYPKGYPMVTRGIVSSPAGPPEGSFLVDGLWNRGTSGGLILAVRGDGEALEWVGVARGAAASTEVRLVPEEGALPERNIRRPYEGPVFLEEIHRIDYGITLSVPMTTIRRFLDERRPALEQRGYALPRL